MILSFIRVGVKVWDILFNTNMSWTNNERVSFSGALFCITYYREDDNSIVLGAFPYVNTGSLSTFMFGQLIESLC